MPTKTSIVKPLAARTSTPEVVTTNGNFQLPIGVKNGCIKSYQDFAYNIHKWVQVEVNETIPPLPPWQMEATLPLIQNEGFNRLFVSTEITRVILNREEIWLLEVLYPTDPRKGNNIEFLVYQAETQDWKVVSSRVENNEYIFVQDLFLTSDGSIWGSVSWNSEYVDQKINEVPILSKYNNDKGYFEFASGALEIPVVRELGYSGWPKLLLDKQDIFWILKDNDGIYAYDPKIQKTIKMVDLHDFKIVNATLSADGSLYFQRDNSETYTSNENYYRWSENMLYRFLPKTRAVVPIAPPKNPWPMSAGILVDHMDRLWLGATGFRNSQGEWNLAHPDPNLYFMHAGDVTWAPPTLMIESSDHRLWYQKNLDQGIQTEGTAWYDPQTGQGCVFTNLPVDVIEDESQQLWAVAEEKLYKLPLMVGK